jgi:hypothetical protein
MNLNIYFNPYPGKSQNKESAKANLLATAKSFKQVSEHIKVETYDPEGHDSIKCFIIFEDEHGAQYPPAEFIREFSGKDGALVQFLFTEIAKGSILYDDALSICEDLILKDFGLAAPVLEYALRNDGMALTISDDKDWKCDFFCFIDHNGNLPNIHGQNDCSPLFDWISSWEKRNLHFIEILKKQFNIICVHGILNATAPTQEEEKGIIESFSRKKQINYNVDGDIVKNFPTRYGAIRELRVYNEGFRVFFVLHDKKPVIGGFYRKSASINQNKAGEQAANRLKSNGYL